MASFNRVILMGNVTRDVELKYTQAKTPVCELGLAANDRRKNAKGEWVEETTYVDVTLWRRTAEIANEYVDKGSTVLVEGRLKTESWTDRSGQKKSKLKIVGERLILLGSRPGNGRRRGNDDDADDDETRAARYGSAGTSVGDDVPW